MANGDQNGIAALLTPDFVTIDVNGTEATADQMIDAVLRLEIDRTKRVAITTVVDVERHDMDAILQQHYSMTSVPDAPRSMPKTLQTLSRDVWRCVDGAWLLHRTETLEVEVEGRDGVKRYRSRR